MQVAEQKGNNSGRFYQRRRATFVRVKLMIYLGFDGLFKKKNGSIITISFYYTDNTSKIYYNIFIARNYIVSRIYNKEFKHMLKIHLNMIFFKKINLKYF